MFSRSLSEQIQDRLSRGQQIMLFMNRRGYASFVSCRSCGEAVQCPHCDVSMTLHQKRPPVLSLLRLFPAHAEALPLLRFSLYRRLWDRHPEAGGDDETAVSPGQSAPDGRGYHR